MMDYGHSAFLYSEARERLLGLARITGLALAYLLSAKLGLMLAVPPGYATPVFPASGIALAAVLIFGYRIWPGVFVGSFALNYWIGANPDSAAMAWTVMPLAIGIGLGAALQAIAGAYLVRRCSAYPLPFSDWRKVVTFLFWGGPASCLVNAVLGVSLLVMAGRIPQENFLYNAATWWIGDTFGVLIFAPLILMWSLSRNRMPVSKRVTATVPSAFAFVLAVLVAWNATSWERGRIQNQFDRQATFLALAFERSLYGDMMAVASLQSFVNTVGEFDHHEFHEFAHGVLAANRGIQALSWNPNVFEEERAAFEADVRRREGRVFHISERGQSGQLRPAAEREEYVVVRFIEPHDGNESAIGYDVASDPTRQQALTLARESGLPVATAPIDLVQETDHQAGVLIFAPVYTRTPSPIYSIHQPGGLRGFVVGVLRMGDVVVNALGNLETEDVVIRLVDETTADSRLLYENARAASGIPILKDEGLLGGSSTLIYEYGHEFGGRRWTLRLSPTQEYIARHRPQNAWMILSGGLLLSGLVVAFTVVLVGRDDALTALVDELTVAKAEAVRASEAKSDFLAAMSHDLRTPLNAILGFSEVMRNRLFGKLGDSRYEGYAEDIHQSGQFLLNLVDDVLDTSKIEAGQFQLCEEAVDVPRLAADCAHMMSPMADESKVRLIVDCPDAVAPLRCDRRVVAQTLNNLLSNAVKFSHPHGEVRTAVRSRDDGAVTIRVSDAGIGMSQKEKVRALEPFRQTRRIHAKQGTGLGLYLCLRFMELHGGTLDIRSKKGSGTIVTLRFPPERSVQSG